MGKYFFKAEKYIHENLFNNELQIPSDLIILSI